MADPVVTAVEADAVKVEATVKADVVAVETFGTKVKALIVKFYPIAIGVLIAATRFI